MLWPGWENNQMGKNWLEGWAQRRVITGLYSTQTQAGAGWLYCDGPGKSWQAAHCLRIRSVPWQQGQLTASWAVLEGPQPGAWGEGLSSHSTADRPRPDTVSFWEPKYKKHTEKLWKKTVRRWSTRFFSLENGWLQAELIAACQNLWGGHQEDDQALHSDAWWKDKRHQAWIGRMIQTGC